MTDPDYTARVLDLLDTGCACHLRAPCARCTAVNEHDVDEPDNDERDRAPWTPEPTTPPEPTPRELAVWAAVDRFAFNPVERRFVFGEHQRRCSATDPVTGITIRSSWWPTDVDDGDSGADLASRIREWAEKQVPA